MASTCEQQINTTILWSVWRGDIFRAPMSILQWRNLKGGWVLDDIGAKYRAILHQRRQTQRTIQGTLTAVCLREWKIQTTNPNPAQIQRNWTTCTTLRWTRLTYPHNRNQNHAQHTNVVFIPPWSYSSARRLHFPRCKSYVNGPPRTGTRYGPAFMRHRYPWM
jgi:hypothetical protein